MHLKLHPSCNLWCGKSFDLILVFSHTEYFLSLLLHTEYHPNPTPQQGELSGCFSIVKLIFLPVNGKQGQQKLTWGGGCWLQ